MAPLFSRGVPPRLQPPGKRRAATPCTAAGTLRQGRWGVAGKGFSESKNGLMEFIINGGSPSVSMRAMGEHMGGHESF